MAKRSVIFLGSGSFSVEVLKILHNSDKFELLKLFSLPDRPVGRKQILTPTPFKMAAEKFGYTVYSAANSTEILAQITEYPDFLIVTDYGVILNDDVLAIPKIESLNVHASLLPKFRGASPIQSVLLNGEPETGVSVMKVVKKMDAGPVYASEKLKISSSDNYSTLILKLGKIGGELLLKTLLKIPEIKPQIQNDDEASYCKKISKQDGIIIFESMSAKEILCKFRAYFEWPKIFFEYKSLRFQIVDISLSAESFSGIFKVVDGVLHVNTFSGVIAITKIKPESKNEMSLKQFLAGNPSFFT